MKPQDATIMVQIAQLTPTLNFDPAGDFTHLIKITTRAPILTDPNVLQRATEPIYVLAGHDLRNNCTHVQTMCRSGDAMLEILESAAFKGSEQLYAP